MSFSALALVFGYLFWDMQKNRVIDEKQDDLNAIINLKIEDIVDWRNEHLRDARMMTEITGLNSLFIGFLKGETEDTTLINILTELTENYDYKSIFLADNDNIVRLTTAAELLNKEYKTLDNPWPDLYLTADSMIRLDIPVVISEAGQRLGTLVLRIDPEVTLFPHIQSWPVQSRTAETLLLRQDGDSILYLNELRHMKGSALRLRLPVSDAALPAAMAARGYEGFFEGEDYRGVKVVSYIRKIPDSPWFMIAKVDKAEIYAPLYEQLMLVSIIVLLTITTFSIIIKMHLGNQRIRFLNELNQTRDKLYSIITHDLKNPFVSIMGFSELLYEKSNNKEFTRTGEYASIIYSSSRNAMDLLHNLTGWTKLQTGKINFNPRETDLANLIDDAVEFAKPAALIKSINIEVNASTGLTLKVDREMLGTILRNLVMNAIKFSYKESKISITSGKTERMAVIEISDSGIGMDEQAISGILNSGTIESTPGTQNEKGTGLGLYICREFIAFHDGELQIISEPGKGSRFIVRLPETAPES
ncbi:MAG TPA: sensor histidine kinase [Bacteroidales bacterium]|nr:sensor histidine kinase [Bacteroidales bacterium]